MELGTERLRVRGEWAGPKERERLWEKVTALYPFYAKYQARAGRPIPVIRLRRVGPAGAGG